MSPSVLLPQEVFSYDGDGLVQATHCFNLSSSCDIDEPDRGSAPLSFLGS